MSVEEQGPDLVRRFAERLKLQGANVRPASGPAAAASAAVEGPPLPLHALRGAATTKPTVEPSVTNRVKIDLKRLQRLGYIVPHGGEKSLLSEEMRQIKRPLIHKAFGSTGEAIRNGNVILVTSARPGEGKTFTAVNLALSIASERDFFVMLVDADSHTQAVLHALGVDATKGLVDLLLDESADLSHIMLRTNIPNFSIVPAGSRHSNVPELLSSHRMACLAEDMATRYRDRFIIIDSSPLLASSEPAVLAQHVGQIVVVVEQNKTGWSLVERAVSRLENCPEVNFVLNKVESKLWEEDYSSHYIYRSTAAPEQ
jgi:exopolysaccharide/PEP-CTERM locus tyrosine autokinase